MKGTKLWQLTLYSEGFLAADPSNTDVGIQVIIQSNSTTSIVGTYVLDTKTTGEAGNISTAVYAVGISQACKTYSSKQLHLTISEGEGGAVQIAYYMNINGEIYQDTHVIIPTWYMLDGSAAYYYDSNVTYELAAWLSASQALSIAQAFTSTEETKIPYFVRGVISNMRNTPEQIVQYKSARFDISNDGTANNQLYCYNTRWLNNTDFVTGEEIAMGNQVVVFGPLQNYDGTTPEIKGYIFEFSEKPNVNDFVITELSLLNIDGMKVTVGWTTNAPKVEVRLLNAKNKQIAKTQTSEKQLTFTAPEMGKYTFCVRPMDETQQYLAEEVTLIINVTSPTDVENVSNETNATEKVLRNGQLFILRDGKTYNVMGQEL